MTRRRKRTVASSRVVVIGVLVGGVVVYGRRNISRFYRFAPYANAVRYYQETVGPLPCRIEDIEEEYNRFERCECRLPVTQDSPRPMYRPVPAACADNRPFLIMIEASPAEWHSWFDQYIIYADYDPENPRVSLEHIYVWELLDRIAADDAHRREVCEGGVAGADAADGPDGGAHREPDASETASRPAR